VALEKDKIKGAVRTDFILSAEIIVIALGTVATAPFAQQVTVVVGIALLMTVGVYGLVAAIVKLDDAGLYLSRRGGAAWRAGAHAAGAAPKLMKLLGVVGTVAMFMVGGGILSHGLPLHHVMIHMRRRGQQPGRPASWLAPLMPASLDAVAGLLAGAWRWACRCGKLRKSNVN
jgi:predicted DNA repair protein MutK